MRISFGKLVFIASALVTIIAFVGHFYLGEKRVELYPEDDAKQQIFGFVRDDGQSSVAWLREAESAWRCRFAVGDRFSCGWEIVWDHRPGGGIDMSGFDTLEVDMAYSGSASRVRIFLRHYNPAYSSPEDVSSAKAMSMSFHVSELGEPVSINLSEFSVAAWWLREQEERLAWFRPELNNIVKIGVDFIEHGQHEVRIDKITLVGKWIRTETLLYAILGYWMFLFIAEGTYMYYRFYRKYVDEQRLVAELENRKSILERERKLLREQADYDRLTGIYNRSGVETFIDNVFGKAGRGNLGVVLMDIDHFKDVNDTYGHDAGDQVLREFAICVTTNLRSSDVFCRWGGEEFLLVCESSSVQELYMFAEKLRQVASATRFEAVEGLSVTVSLGVTMIREADFSFDEVLRRADQALYKAKRRGRNRTCIGD